MLSKVLFILELRMTFFSIPYTYFVRYFPEAEKMDIDEPKSPKAPSSDVPELPPKPKSGIYIKSCKFHNRVACPFSWLP